MKKGKTSKILGFKSMKVTYGTVDSVNFKSIYLNIQTWAQPTKESLNWSRVVLNMGRSIKHIIYDIIDPKLFEDNFILDLDLRASGLVVDKKSFLNLEINFYLKNSEISFKSPIFKTSMKKISRVISQEIFNKHEYFTFSLKKTIKTDKEKILQT